MNIVIFLGGFTYNSANEFSYKIGEFFESIGIRVFYIDLKTEDLGDQLNNAFSNPIAFVLGFNGIGCSLKYENQNLLNYLELPYIYYLLDHPSHHIDRLKEKINKKIIISLDNSHADYIDQHEEIDGVTTFIPTAGYAMDYNYNSMIKIYDVVFTGYLKSKQDLDGIFTDNLFFIKEHLDELIKNKRDIYIDREVLKFIDENEILREALSKEKRFIDTLIVKSDFYIRGKKRYEIIKYMLDQNIKIDFFGNISKNHEFMKYENFNYHGTVEYNELIDLYKKSKITLNSMPNFPEGGHDRLFMSMLAGSIPLTDTNVYIDENLPDSVLKFNYIHIEEIVPLVNRVLNNEAILKKYCDENYQFASQNHTWANRMNSLIYVVSQANEYWNMQV